MNANEAYRVLAAWQSGDKSVRSYLDHALAAAPVGTSISTDGTGGGRVAWKKYAQGWGPKYATVTADDKLQTLPLGMAVWSLLSLAMGTAPPPETCSDNRRTVSPYETALIVIAAMRPGDRRSFGARAGHPYDVVVDAVECDARLGVECAPFLHYRVMVGPQEDGHMYENVQLAAEAVADALATKSP